MASKKAPVIRRAVAKRTEFRFEGAGGGGPGADAASPLRTYLRELSDSVLEAVDAAYPHEMLLVFKDAVEATDQLILVPISTVIEILPEAYAVSSDNIAFIDQTIMALRGTENGRPDGLVWVFADFGAGIGLCAVARAPDAEPSTVEELVLGSGGGSGGKNKLPN